MRTDLLDAVVNEVNGYHMRPVLQYDYDNVRSRLIFEALSQGVQYVCNNAVEGDIAEFGTSSGFSSFTIARAMAIYQRTYARQLAQQGLAQRKALHLFDSFQGLPKPDNPVDLASPYVKSGRWQQGTFGGPAALTQQELKALCASTYDQDRIFVFPGWFSQSLAGVAAQARFAMLHIDCDLYSSTAEVLEHVLAHGHVAEGCVVFFDDWNCNRSSPRMGQRRAWHEAVERHRIEFSDCGDYAVLGHKFIIHGPG